MRGSRLLYWLCDMSTQKRHRMIVLALVLGFAMVIPVLSVLWLRQRQTVRELQHSRGRLLLVAVMLKQFLHDPGSFSRITEPYALRNDLISEHTLGLRVEGLLRGDRSFGQQDTLPLGLWVAPAMSSYGDSQGSSFYWAGDIGGGANGQLMVSHAYPMLWHTQPIGGVIQYVRGTEGGETAVYWLPEESFSRFLRAATRHAHSNGVPVPDAYEEWFTILKNE